jgi:16S rRNA (cytidine1402-2'-O)-methyltransferase
LSDKVALRDTDECKDPGPGVLYVVSTPLGNLNDITLRAIEVLKKVHLIACEDTRKSKVLLRKWDILTHTVSLHRFTESRKTRAILRRLEKGEHVALITDAGTPTISDPGARLVRAALDASLRVIPIPGPSAVTAALCVSGMEAQTFTFLGFAPRTDRDRRAFFTQIRDQGRTTVFFETSKRILDTLRISSALLGVQRIAVMRELTKVHEEILTGTSADVLRLLEAKGTLKGEIIVVVEGPQEIAPLKDLEHIVRELIADGLTGKKLADEARKRYNVRKSEAYDKFLELTER